MTEKVILILHGWGSSAENWSKIKEMLEGKGLRVFLPDLPGFGQSPPLERAWSVEDYVNWLRQYCQENNLAGFFLLGHSFGGSIALNYGLKYPGNVKKLLLVAPAIIRVRDGKKEMVAKVAKIVGKFSLLPGYSLVRRTFYRYFVKSDYPGLEGPMRETYFKVVKRDFSDQLHKIAVPTVYIWGDKDNITPFKYARFAKEKTPGAELKALPGVGHLPRVEAPDLFVKIILESL